MLKSAHELAAELRESERTLAQPPTRGAATNLPINAKLPTGRPASIGFYVNDDDNGYPDLKRALPHLDWFVPSWMSLDGPGMELKDGHRQARAQLHPQDQAGHGDPADGPECR